MADTTTTALGLTKPQIGASENTWGEKINTNMDLIDAVLDDYPTTGSLSNRNVIINGGMNVKQRDNRAAATFSSRFYAGPDRWLVNRSGTGSTGFSQIASTAYGGTKAAEATFLAADGELYVVTQRIEAANVAHLAGQTVTLSFWASGSSDVGSSLLNAVLSYATVADNFASETTISTNAISYSGTAAYYTFTFTLPANAANGVAVKIEGAKTGGTGTFTLKFGGVQLEAGTVATPFEHRSYGQDLAACQRYYYKMTYSEGGGIGNKYRGATLTNVFSSAICFPTEMRVTPTFTQITAPTIYGSTEGTHSIAARGINLRVNCVGGGSYRMYSGLFSVDSEL